MRAFACVLLVACSTQERPAQDAGATEDSGRTDAGAVDTGTVDAGGPAGFGALSGDCDVLDDEITGGFPTLFSNTIDFGTDPYDDSDLGRLTAGGQEVIADGNLNEGSLLSEVFAYEVLARCEGASLLKTENEINYIDPMGKRTDLLISIDDRPLGVSVTRAVGFPRDAPYTEQQAETLLGDKLGDIRISSANVQAPDVWDKQILHVIAYGPSHLTSLEAAYGRIDATTKADTIVIVTVTDGDDDFLY